MKSKKKSFAWSYSALTTYETCALKDKFRRDKAPRPPNKYMARGIEVHQLGEDYLNGKLKSVPIEYKYFAKPLIELRKAGAQAELELAFTRQWEPTEWFGERTWFRCKLDVQRCLLGSARKETTLRVIDFKTGRPKEYPEQERINVMAALLGTSEAVAATMEFWYLDHGVTLPKKPKLYVRKNMLEGTKKEFTIRAARMEAEKKFLPKKGAHCSYCDYSKRKGGPCKFN
jgi:CRISPR/Cas system-associated exonuclease Cas4 (RecB family)